jgi:hypothetical protein
MLGDEFLHDPLPFVFLVLPILQLPFADTTGSRKSLDGIRNIANSMNPLSRCQVSLSGHPLSQLIDGRRKMWEIERHLYYRSFDEIYGRTSEGEVV